MSELDELWRTRQSQGRKFGLVFRGFVLLSRDLLLIVALIVWLWKQ